MRPSVLVAIPTLAVALACGGAADEPDLVPAGGQLAPAAVGVDPFAGRWPAAVEGEGGWALAAPCGDSRFVQVRSDGIGGWEMVVGTADELRILPVLTAAPADGGAQFEVAPEPGGPPVDPVVLTWVEPDRIARFSTVPDVAFAAPGAADGLPEAACP